MRALEKWCVTKVAHCTQVTLQGILFGSNTLPINANKAIFEAVHEYIKKVNDFNAAKKRAIPLLLT